MKLVKGVYENVISEQVSKDIDEAQNEGLICKKENIDIAESPSILTAYVSKIIKNKLNDESLSLKEKRDYINRIIDLIDDDNNDKIKEHDKLLTAVINNEEEVKLKVTNKSLIRPLSGFRVSNLFTGGQSAVPLGSEIERDIICADKIFIIVSFLRLSGINLIYDALYKFCSTPGHELRIITTTYCGITEAKALERLSQLPNTQIRISYNTKIERLHAKAFIFERNSGLHTAYIGSSNLSKSAQTDGLEWNIRITNVENPHILKAAIATFEQYWNSQNFEDFNEGGIKRFYDQTKKELEQFKGTAIFHRYSILPHQKQILDRLQAIREAGINKNLIVAATGTGKTVISAFDYKINFVHSTQFGKILFVAHREEILKQSLFTYRSVLMNANFGDMWVGSYKPSNIDHLFVSVQTFNSNYSETFAKLPSDYYEYIVIDEAHHLVANSYRKIIEHFTPKILIGLTATPERMDGQSLLPDFCNRISAEIRLPQALDEGLLTPFQYLCISDDTDLTDDELMLGNKYIPSKIITKLCTRQRVALIVDKLRYYLADEYKCKALCFCANTDHARFMAEELSRVGFKAASLTVDNSEDRRSINKKFENGEINYLCVVDMYNEGVDIPAVDTVLFLRPTESITIFLQQLGRGLRLYPGKQVLTVLDFVAQLNQKYDYASRFRSLMTHTDKNIVDQIKNGFTLLPRGCSIHMEKKAKEYVLQNIKAAIYNKNRLINELRSYSVCPSLSEFISNNGQDIRLIYKNNLCWTKLKKNAGFCDYTEDGNTKRYEKGLGRLIHFNTVSFFNFIKATIANDCNINCKNEKDKTFALMFYYVLYQDNINAVGVSSVSEAIRQLNNYPLFIEEIKEIVEYLIDHIYIKTFYIGSGLPESLEQYGCYTREDIFTIFGRQTAEKRMQGNVAGVFNFEEYNTEAFFVTLNKSDADFSPSTQYDDYVISEYKFHWQSQNNDSHTGRGKRFVEQEKNKKKFLLFVRDQKKDGFGNTCPFHCFGLVDYIRSYGDCPMNIEWKLQEPIMPQYLKSV